MEIGPEKKEKIEIEGERERRRREIEKTVHLSGNDDVVPQSGHRKRWCHNLDLK